MSHFCGLVIMTPEYAENNGFEDSLEKYNENIEYEPYVSGEVSDYEKVRFLEYYNKDKVNEDAIKKNPLLNSGIEICSNVIKCKPEKTDRGLHPAQKPVSLMKYLIEMTTLEGQLVLDPFCGCGSTLQAAKELNRDYIGIEIDPKYVEIINKRLNE